MASGVDVPEIARISYDRAVALYCRLSRNPNGTKDSVEVQTAVGLADAARRWPGRLVLLFTDDDLSADDDTYRPGYEAMLEAIARGEIGDVLCRVQARISRGKVVWPRFQVYCLAAGIKALTTWETGSISLLEGEDMAGDVTNLFNVHHRVTTKLGVLETLEQRARAGRPHGGRPYGYAHPRDTTDGATYVIVPDEATTILAIVDLVLAGHNQAAIARHLNERKMLRRNGGPWKPNHVKRVVTNPVIAGHHTRHGKRTGLRGVWDPIVDEVTFDAVQQVFSQPRVVVDKTGRKRTYTGARRPSRAYLLTGGFAVCGLCNTPLIGQTRTLAKTGPTFHYICSSGENGCGGASLIGPPLERYVTDEFLAWVDSPRFLAFLAAGDADADRRAELKLREDALTERRHEVGRAIGRLELSIPAGQAAELALNQEAARIVEERAELAPLGPMGMTFEAITVGWEYASLAERQAWMSAAQLSVRVFRADGTRGFTEGRVELSIGGQVVGGQASAARARAKARRKPKPMNSKTAGG